MNLKWEMNTKLSSNSHRIKSSTVSKLTLPHKNTQTQWSIWWQQRAQDSMTPKKTYDVPGLLLTLTANIELFSSKEENTVLCTSSSELKNCTQARMHGQHNWKAIQLRVECQAHLSTSNAESISDVLHPWQIFTLDEYNPVIYRTEISGIRCSCQSLLRGVDYRCSLRWSCVVCKSSCQRRFVAWGWPFLIIKSNASLSPTKWRPGVKKTSRNPHVGLVFNGRI